MGVDAGVGWLLGGAGCLSRWREAWRLSLREVLALTHQEGELQWREELLLLAGRRAVHEALRHRTDVCLLPVFRAAVLGGQQGPLLETLDHSESLQVVYCSVFTQNASQCQLFYFNVGIKLVFSSSREPAPGPGLRRPGRGRTLPVLHR